MTAANFLRYVDAKMYDGGRRPERAKGEKGFGPIPFERTSVTTLRHVDGAISMARGATADTASSDFFICVGDQPALDFGGARAADGQGFAAFGRVVSGMDVVRKIQAGKTNDREKLLEPVTIVRVYRR